MEKNLLHKETFSLHNRFLPQLLFYMLVFTIPYFQLRQLSAAYQFMKIDWLLTMILAVIIIPDIMNRKSIPENLQSNLWPWLALFLVVNLISSLLSPYRGPCFARILNPILVGYVFIALSMLMISKKGFEKYLPFTLAWSIGINSFMGFLGYFFHYTPFVGERGRGFTIGANNMALMCVFTIPLLVHLIFHAKNRKNAIVATLLLIVNVLGVISSASRGGFLSLTIIALLLLFELRHRFHPRYLGLVIVIIGIAMITIINVVPERYFQRQQTILKGSEADRATKRRMGYLIVSWDSIKKHPLLGTGTLSFRNVWVNSEMARWFDMEERSAHNTYMEVLVGTGIIGFFFFMMLLWQTFSNFTKARRLFSDSGRHSMASLASAYRFSFIAVTIYFLFKSGLDHKLFLLGIPLSQVALTLAGKHLPEKEKS
ncbi:O-antigen ligase family protein [Candidatus Pacearchaeota archaeon]|nr:O-antigen ligase family protein [Candidatus Pacearchaeota archaeon]